jgi:GDPmannose 4,6-dehydratase
MSKKVLITGITGQDGAILSRKLIDIGYKVVGLFRQNTADNFWRLKELGLLEKIELVECEILSYNDSLPKILKDNNFEAIFHFAGSSFTGDSFNKPWHTFSLNTFAVFAILEAIKSSSPETPIFIANSSEIFGQKLSDKTAMNSKSIFSPINPYALSHLSNINASNYYRNLYNLHISNMILFNHESRYRGNQFLTRKISKGVAEISKGRISPIELGNINMLKDWGSAFEFADAFILMMQKKIRSDITIGTGKLTSIRDLIKVAFGQIDKQVIFVGDGLDEKGLDEKTGRALISINPRYFRQKETFPFVADVTEAKKILNFSPEVTALEIIPDMISYELKLLR